jgi:hypothetical protein
LKEVSPVGKALFKARKLDPLRVKITLTGESKNRGKDGVHIHGGLVGQRGIYDRGATGHDRPREGMRHPNALIRARL